MGEEGEDQQNGTASPPASDPNDGLIVAPIKVIIPGVMSDDDSDEEERRVVKKKKKKKKKAAAEIDQLTAEEEKKMDKTMMLTKTFGQAIRLINEQKVRFIVFCLISQIDVWSRRRQCILARLISVFLFAQSVTFQRCCFRHEKSKRPDKRRFG